MAIKAKRGPNDPGDKTADLMYWLEDQLRDGQAAQAAAAHLADVAEAALLAIAPANGYRQLLREAITNYRVAAGQDTGDKE